MILADKIINERKRNGWSQEELAEMLGVSRQAVSKWESAQSVPDIQKILIMARIFGVTTDYLLKDEMGEKEDAPVMYPDGLEPLPTVTVEDACAFMEAESLRAPRIADAVTACILSPVPLIFLAGLSDSGMLRMKESLAEGIGILALFFIVAAAVSVFIREGSLRENFEWLEKEDFDTAYGVAGIVSERKAAYKSRKDMYIILGVVLCIICPVPLIAAGLAEAPDWVCIVLTCVLLMIVSAAVNLFIRAGIVDESYDILLQKNDYSPREKKVSRKAEPVSGAYWCIATAVFLALGFMYDAWDRCWIVWPVAGVLYAGVIGIVRALSNSSDR